jgi:hypothetical protein
MLVFFLPVPLVQAEGPDDEAQVMGANWRPSEVMRWRALDMQSGGGSPRPAPIMGLVAADASLGPCLHGPALPGRLSARSARALPGS